MVIRWAERVAARCAARGVARNDGVGLLAIIVAVCSDGDSSALELRILTQPANPRHNTKAMNRKAMMFFQLSRRKSDTAKVLHELGKGNDCFDFQ